jgi:hypothetical protein
MAWAKIDRPFEAMDVGHADAAKGPTVETLVTFNVVD